MEKRAEKQAANDEGSVQCVPGKGDDVNYQSMIKEEKIKREPKEKAQTAENELINGRAEEGWETMVMRVRDDSEGERWPVGAGPHAPQTTCCSVTFIHFFFFRGHLTWVPDRPVRVCSREVKGSESNTPDSFLFI